MSDHIVIPFGPRENRPHRTRSASARTRRPSTHKPTTPLKSEQVQWDTRYVDLVRTVSNQEVAGITLGKLAEYYKDRDIDTTLPNRLATLALQEPKGLLDRDICYASQSAEPDVTQIWPTVEGFVVTSLYSLRKLNWLMHRLPQGSNEDFEQLQALPDWLTVQKPQLE